MSGRVVGVLVLGAVLAIASCTSSSSSADPCAAVDDGSCKVKPFACYTGASPTLSQTLASHYANHPSDPCSGGIWAERVEACGLVNVVVYEGPPSSFWFDANTGKLVGYYSPSDTFTCTGYGTIHFPCATKPTCTHLCGPSPSTGPIGQTCPLPADAGAD